MDSKACVDHDEVSIEEVFQCGLHDVSGSPWMSIEEEYQCGLQGVSGSPWMSTEEEYQYGLQLV